MAEAVKLAALRVGPELDASKYVAGAHAVEAANDSMAQSSLAAGNAVGQMTPKISEAGNIVARLSHQYVDGYGSAVRFQKGIDGLQRAIETGNIEMAQAEVILEGMHRRLGIMANAEELAANGQHQLATAAANVNTRLAAQETVTEIASAAQFRLGDATKYSAMQQRNLVFQLNDVAVSLAGGMNPLMVFMQQGSQIATIYGPEEGGVGKALQETGNLALGLVTKFWPIAGAVGTATAAIAGMTYEINRTGKVTVGFGDTALATWQVISDGIYQWIKPAVDAIAPWFASAWEWTVGATRDAGNFIVREMVGATDIIATSLGSIPDLVLIGVQGASQAVVDGVTWMIAETMRSLNGLVDDANGLLEGIGLGRPLGGFGNPDDMKSPNMDFGGSAAQKRLNGMWAGLGQRGEALSQRDLMGEFFGAVSGQAQSNALARLAEDADKAGGAIKAANDNFGAFLDKVNEGQRVFENTRTPFEDLGAELGRLDGMLADGVISWETYGRAVSAAVTDTASSAIGALSNISGQLSQAFEDNKALAIANAVIKGGEAAVSSYAAGAALGGPLLGAAFAGASLLATGKMIADIASSTKDSKSLSSSGAGGGAAAAGTSGAAAPGGGKSASFTFHGETQSTSSVRDGIEQLIAFLDDRDLKINFEHK